MWVDFIADLRGMTTEELTTTNAERILDWWQVMKEKKISQVIVVEGAAWNDTANLKRYFDVRPMNWFCHQW